MSRRSFVRDVSISSDEPTFDDKGSLVISTQFLSEFGLLQCASDYVQFTLLEYGRQDTLCIAEDAPSSHLLSSPSPSSFQHRSHR